MCLKGSCILCCSRAVLTLPFCQQGLGEACGRTAMHPPIQHGHVIWGDEGGGVIHTRRGWAPLSREGIHTKGLHTKGLHSKEALLTRVREGIPTKEGHPTRVRGVMKLEAHPESTDTLH